MKIVQINATCGIGSTGRIVEEISDRLCEKGIENYILYSLGSTERRNSYKFSNKFITKFNALLSFIFGNNGFEDFLVTKRVIAKLKKIKPDIVHLHNVHSHDINIKLLFRFLKKVNVKIYWTFHDCWAFTGYCHHFDFISCNKWRNACDNCPEFKKHSFFFDFSKRIFFKKKNSYNLENITIITPSYWMASLVSKSFFSSSQIVTIHNGINLNKFHISASNLRKQLHLETQKIILFVANKFTRNKGILDILFISKNAPKNFTLLLVGDILGLDISEYPNIVHIKNINNIEHLCEIYSIADVFVNPSYEETLPTTNIEALSCGTPVICYNTGGSLETIDDKCGILIDRGDKNKLLNAILEIEKYCFSKEDCIRKSKSFDSEAAYKKYLELYS